LNTIEHLSVERSGLIPENDNTLVLIVNTTTKEQLRSLEKIFKKEKKNVAKLDNMVIGDSHYYVVAIQKKEKKFYIVDTDCNHIKNRTKFNRNKLLSKLVTTKPKKDFI